MCCTWESGVEVYQCTWFTLNQVRQKYGTTLLDRHLFKYKFPVYWGFCSIEVKVSIRLNKSIIINLVSVTAPCVLFNWKWNTNTPNPCSICFTGHKSTVHHVTWNLMAIYQMAEKTSSLEGYANEPRLWTIRWKEGACPLLPSPHILPRKHSLGSFLSGNWWIIRIQMTSVHSVPYADLALEVLNRIEMFFLLSSSKL